MADLINVNVATLAVLRWMLKKRAVSERLVPRASIERIIELAEVYTKPSEGALIYLELPLEEEGPLDVQFCITESLTVPEGEQFARLRACLSSCASSGGKLGADFAFDAAFDYSVLPCLYAYMEHCDPSAVASFFTALGATEYLPSCLAALSNAPAGWRAYYIGLMPRAEGIYGRLGFRHTLREAEYRENIEAYLRDLHSIGYDKPIGEQMQQQLANSAKYGLLADTQLSLAPEGGFVDKLGLDSVVDRRMDFPELALITDAGKRDFIAQELKKCCFATMYPLLQRNGNSKILILHSYIRFIKCTWTKGAPSKLKAYLCLSACTKGMRNEE